ncbi:MAG: hypothetical protein QNI87_09070 [Erythrobacter sp.]|uniref:hypothetical protein n=1 Tax=Erythrobacter sp. TaxID=1042 RepID=UPI002601DFD2|nr:hypothetical protein [Erythrobacter sp.]MDJ0978675.1 hypothetical protein [Erythrobacter sp.]
MSRPGSPEMATTQGLSEEGPPSPSASLARFFCLLPAAYFLAVAGYALLNFSSYGADFPRFMRYIAAPGAIAAALIGASLFLSPRKSSNIGLAATAILLGLLVVEVFLNARIVMAMIGLATTVGNAPDADDEIARGRSSIPPMYTSKRLTNVLDVDRLDQALLGGIPNEEVLLCSQQGAPLYYNADRFGFNNDDNVHDAALEVMIVGDSFVEGYCQPRPDTFAGRMRNRRPQTASIGMRGGGPLFELALVGRYGQQFKPDWVVMGFFEGNDWENLAREASTPWLAEALEPGADFGPVKPSTETVERSKEVIDRWWKEDISPTLVLKQSSFVRNIFALNQVWGIMGLDYPRISRDQPVFEKTLERTKALTESWGGKFVLVYIPQAARYRGLLDKSFLYDDLRGMVLDAAAKHEVEVVDLTTVFSQSDDPGRLYAADGHFSPSGSEAAAHALEAKLVSLESD